MADEQPFSIQKILTRSTIWLRAHSEIRLCMDQYRKYCVCFRQRSRNPFINPENSAGIARVRISVVSEWQKMVVKLFSTLLQTTINRLKAIDIF